MVKYYGRAKTRTGSVNTTQLGLKLAGCPSNVGRKGTLTRAVQKRVNCALKVCGWRPVHGVTGRKPGIFNFPSEPTNALAREAWSGPFPCTLAQPFTRGVKGGIGHIYTPRTKCGCTCVADCSGIDDRFFPVGTPLYGLPRCAGGDCCLAVSNAPICVDQSSNVCEIFPGMNWRRMVNSFQTPVTIPVDPPGISVRTRETLPLRGGGFDDQCWIPRAAFNAAQQAGMDARIAEMLFPICFKPYRSNGIEEVLSGFNYTAFPSLTTSDKIQWAILRSRGSQGLDCLNYTEDGGSGMWLLARTRNNDYGNYRPLNTNAKMEVGVTLSLFWLALSTKTLISLAGGGWGTEYIEVVTNEQEYITTAAWPVLRYHFTPVQKPDDRPVPYTGDIGLSDCGCPEIPSGNVPPLFQEWGLLSCYLKTCVPWNAPNKAFDNAGPGWIDFPGPPGPSPPAVVDPNPNAPGGMYTNPILSGWQSPEECTFGSHIPGMQFPDTPPACCRLSDATLRWYCPEPPPGFSFFPK